MFSLLFLKTIDVGNIETPLKNILLHIITLICLKSVFIFGIKIDKIVWASMKLMFLCYIFRLNLNTLYYYELIYLFVTEE